MKMHWLVCLAPAFPLLSLALAQPPSGDNFEELAQKAGALLDSRPADAATLYKQALALRSDWAEGWMSLGGALYQLDRYAECTDALRKGIALSPKMGTAWAFLGLCEAELDDPEQALADIRKGEALGLGGNRQFEVAVRVRAAQLLISSSSFDEAPMELLPLARVGENSAIVQRTMGLAALGISSKLADLPPEKRAVIEMTGKAAWALAGQHPTEAAEAYKQLVERYPNEPGVHYAVGLYYTETDMNAALGEFQKEVKANPKHWPSLIVIGSLNVRLGEGAAALEALRQAIKYAPAKYRWLCHLEMGRAQLISDQVDAAIAEFQTAARLSPQNPQAHFFLAQAYRRVGKKEEAKAETQEFEKLKVQQDPAGVPGLRLSVPAR